MDIPQGQTGREAGNPVKQRHIDFRELLERLLPLDELPAADRSHVQRALLTGISDQVERAALHALRRLEQTGALKRLPPDRGRPRHEMRFQARGGLDVISVRIPAAGPHEGVLVFPRALLPAHARAGLDQVRRLLKLDDPGALSDPGAGDTRRALLEHLDQAGREVLGAHRVRLVTHDEEPGDAPAALDAELAAEAEGRPGALLYCPDAARAPRLRDAAAGAGVRGLALAAVVSGAGRVIGVLEVATEGPEPYGPEELAMVALMADTCGTVLERAERIERLMFVDPLTGAYNRAYFDLQLSNEMARAQREGSGMALCIADIDDFKSFNTLFGYEAGNQVLLQVVQTLRAGIRPFDTVARWGGEEFALLLTSPVQADDALTICERLRGMVERQIVQIEGLDGELHRVAVTVSVGVALFPDHAEEAQDLWRAANQALLEAKRPPKNQVVFHRPEGRARAEGR